MDNCASSVLDESRSTRRSYSRRSSSRALPNRFKWIRSHFRNRRTASPSFLHGKVPLSAPLFTLFVFFFLNYNCSHLLMGLPLFALVQPMHIHYTGWRQENNYVPMNFDGRVQHHPMHHHQQQQQHQQQHIGNSHFGGTDHSLSFDSQHTGPSSLRDPFTPVMNGNSHLNQYEIQVDSAAAAVDRPRWEWLTFVWRSVCKNVTNLC